jgi:hypothetical protein
MRFPSAGRTLYKATVMFGYETENGVSAKQKETDQTCRETPVRAVASLEHFSPKWKQALLTLQQHRHYLPAFVAGAEWSSNCCNFS